MPDRKIRNVRSPLYPTDRSQRTDRMASMQADETGSVTAPFSSPSEMCPCTAAQSPRPWCSTLLLLLDSPENGKRACCRTWCRC